MTQITGVPRGSPGIRQQIEQRQEQPAARPAIRLRAIRKVGVVDHQNFRDSVPPNPHR
jgi:hypothetical protein